MAGPSLSGLFIEMCELFQGIHTRLDAIEHRITALEGRPVLVSVAEFARLADCSRETVVRAIDRGDIEVLRLGARTVRIPIDQLYTITRPADTTAVVTALDVTA